MHRGSAHRATLAAHRRLVCQPHLPQLNAQHCSGAAGQEGHTTCTGGISTHSSALAAGAWCANHTFHSSHTRLNSAQPAKRETNMHREGISTHKGHKGMQEDHGGCMPGAAAYSGKRHDEPKGPCWLDTCVIHVHQS